VPTISITSPDDGARRPAPACCRSSPMRSADTVDIASVEFFEGAASLGKVTAKPFTFSWQATAGSPPNYREKRRMPRSPTPRACRFRSRSPMRLRQAAAGGAGGAVTAWRRWCQRWLRRRAAWRAAAPARRARARTTGGSAGAPPSVAGSARREQRGPNDARRDELEHRFRLQLRAAWLASSRRPWPIVARRFARVATRPATSSRRSRLTS